MPVVLTRIAADALEVSMMRVGEREQDCALGGDVVTI